MCSSDLKPNGGTPPLALEPQPILGHEADRRGRLTSSPPQFGQRWLIAEPQAVQNVHSKLQITAGPSSDNDASHRSQTFLSSSTVLGLPRPQLVDKPLVFVEEPALPQLLVLHSVEKNSLNTSRRISEVLNGEKSTE